MNPFDLSGPQFLVFYVVFAVCLHLAFKPLARALAGGEGAGPSPFDLSHVDPYLVAYLRGQRYETARLAALSLLDRGLLTASGEELATAADTASKVRRPLERTVLEAFASKAKAATLLADAKFKGLTEGLAHELERMGLLYNSAQRARVVVLRLALAVLLVYVSVTKIQIALARGRHNLGFLMLLTFAFGTAMLLRPAPLRTPLGEATLETLRTAFGGLKARAARIGHGGQTAELSILVGVFGLGALAGTYRSQAEVLFPAAMKRASAGGGSATGCGIATSCGSSSCGGSSCGGGGCGGGCGGCGG